MKKQPKLKKKWIQKAFFFQFPLVFARETMIFLPDTKTWPAGLAHMLFMHLPSVMPPEHRRVLESSSCPCPRPCVTFSVRDVSQTLKNLKTPFRNSSGTKIILQGLHKVRTCEHENSVVLNIMHLTSKKHTLKSIFIMHVCFP